MQIEKCGKVYEVTERGKKWVLTTKLGKLEVEYLVSKEDNPTEEALREYVRDQEGFF